MSNLDKLFYHVTRGDIKSLKDIISNDATVITATDDMKASALSHACAAKKEQSVLFLLQHGANVDHVDQFGFSPLMIASRLGDISIVKMLLKFGSKLDLQDDKGYSALIVASKKNHYDVVAYLLQQGASTAVVTKENENALFFAAAVNNERMVKLLLQNGSNPNSETKYEDVPLFHAANHGNIMMCKYLISFGANVNFQSKTHLTTALFIAARNSNYFVVQKLVEYGGDFTLKYKDGLSLHQRNDKEIDRAIYAAIDKLKKLKEQHELQKNANGITPQQNTASNSEEEPTDKQAFNGVSLQENCMKASSPKSPAPVKDELLSFMMAEFDKIVGMDHVKAELFSFYKKVRLDKIRSDHYLSMQADKPQVSYIPPKENGIYHMLFTGPPGTGKTTIANLVAKVMLKMNLIQSDKVVVVSNALDLIAGYVGQTPAKVDAKVAEASGGVLFIDEAYSIVKSKETSKNTFGREAIDTLMKHMDPPSCVFILAGYEDKMNDFLQVNEGLGRRIPYRYDFSPYTTQQLTQILEKMCLAKDEDLDLNVLENVPNLIEKNIPEYQRNTQNAGLIANWISFAQMNRDNRIDINEARKNPDIANLLTLKDFKKAMNQLKKMKIEER